MEPTPLKVNVKLCFVLAAMFTAGGCQYLPPLPERPRGLFDAPVVARGHLVAAEQLAQITPGVTARADVQALLGSPSQTSTFNDDTWYYISSTTRQRPGRALSVSEQRVVVVDFAANGTVNGVRELGERDGRQVAFVGRETPVPGTERSLMQGLFGNIGRFNPAGGIAGSQQQAPGNAPNSSR
jgi:outer membrane protein assembly factor BamE (lipoprotein component of BamABCDE complex)